MGARAGISVISDALLDIRPECAFQALRVDPTPAEQHALLVEQHPPAGVNPPGSPHSALSQGTVALPRGYGREHQDGEGIAWVARQSAPELPPRSGEVTLAHSE